MAARLIAVRLVTVVEPRVELPVVSKLAVVKVPEIVEEPRLAELETRELAERV